ncbi:hypothetical protein HHA01_18140 [Halomonas halmophila]|uniref:Uncharacterized protein n=1 Tax=Halomonas halmophila TaxID=252 RepID=A0A4Y4F080_9GAMM|nr:hypothetical protein HHA01_18140 [Halomonas halmophila]
MSYSKWSLHRFLTTQGYSLQTTRGYRLFDQDPPASLPQATQAIFVPQGLNQAPSDLLLKHVKAFITEALSQYLEAIQADQQ